MSRYLDMIKKMNPKKTDSVKNHFDVQSILREKPYSIKELVEKTGIPNSTMHNIKIKLLELSKIKYVGNHKVADINYNLIEARIESWLKSFFKKRFPPPGLNERFIDVVAMKLQEEKDEKFDKAFKKVCKKNKIMFVPSGL